MEKKRLLTLNTTTLAYIGDGVYEVFVRENIIEAGNIHADGLHKLAIKYVSAKGQAKAVKSMLEILSEEERLLVRRSRNHKVSTKAKNTDIMTYKWATAFEALVGYLYLDGNLDRVNFIMKQAMEKIDE